MSKKSIYWGIMFSLILSSLIFILGLDRKDYVDNPTEVYQVYLNGEIIGTIEDEEKLYDLINEEQQSLKKEFDVNKIYAPIGLETTKLVTYEGKVDSVDSVYNKVKDVEPFTIKGYEVTIIQSEDKIYTLNILKKEMLEEAIDNTIKVFVDEEEYEKYLNNKQEKIVTTGKQIDDISIREKITIKEKYLSTDDKIYTNVSDLSRFILFGSDEAQGTHIVKMGETIKDIAKSYQLNVKEFLIVNPEILSENSLLFTGQVVNIGLINPIVSVVVEEKIVQDMTIAYEKEVKWDSKIQWGKTYTEQFGQNGTSRVNIKTETINGTITQVDRESSEIIVPVINEVVVKGGLPNTNIGNGIWAWPTLKPFVITSEFAWRTDPVYGGREEHKGIDISGTGYGSPIFAASSGSIIDIGYHYELGNYIIIDHGNGYKTTYMHMSGFADNMNFGTYVGIGEVIGYMGSTGKSTGTHLDFRVSLNGVYFDPMTLYY